MKSGKGALIAALVLGIVHICVTYASHREADKFPFEYWHMILLSVLVTFVVFVCNSYAASKEEDKDAQIVESVAAVCAFVVIVYTIVHTRAAATQVNEAKAAALAAAQAAAEAKTQALAAATQVNEAKTQDIWKIWAPEDYKPIKGAWSPKRLTLLGVIVYTVLTLVAVTKTR